MVLGDLLLLTGSPDAEQFTETYLKDAADRVPGGFVLAESLRTRLAFLLRQRGEDERANRLIAEAGAAARTLPAGHAASAIERAAIHAFKGERDAVFDALAEVKDPVDMLAVLDRDPHFASMRSDERFQTMLTRVRRQLDEQRIRAAKRGLLDVTSLIGAQ